MKQQSICAIGASLLVVAAYTTCIVTGFCVAVLLYRLFGPPPVFVSLWVLLPVELVATVGLAWGTFGLCFERCIRRKGL